MMSQANDSNIELHRHMTSIIDHLKILSSTPDQLEKSLPVMMELNGKKKNFNSDSMFSVEFRRE